MIIWKIQSTAGQGPICTSPQEVGEHVAMLLAEQADNIRIIKDEISEELFHSLPEFEGY